MTDRPLETLAAEMLDAALAAGADAADALVIDGTSVTIDVRNGALEQAERAEGIDLGLRVFVGQRQSSVSVSDTSPETRAMMAERAVAMAREAPEDLFAGLAAPDALAHGWDMDALELADPSPEPGAADLQAQAQEAEAAAAAMPGISQVQSATAAYAARRVHLAATNGFSGGYNRTDSMLSCVAIAGTGSGMERDYDSDGRIFAADMRAARDIGERAGLRAAERLNPRKPQTGTYPVLFDERVSASLIGHLMGAINGSAIARGASWLRDAMDQPVLPDGLSLTEDPHRPRVQSSRPFDAEGLPTKPRDIVRDGVLTGWTLDLATARKLGLASTANAVRSPGGTPSPSPWGLLLTQGTQSRDDLIRDLGTGLLVTSMIGSTINPNTGDYSRGAAGFWIEGGEIAFAVNECTVAGNLRDMLRRIIPANDARPHVSRVVPSLLIEGMTLAGA